MSNYDELQLWLVSEGDVTPASPTSEWDGQNSILVAATSVDGALRVAEAYDIGRTQADNLPWLGKTLAVVTLRDSETGVYA